MQKMSHGMNHYALEKTIREELPKILRLDPDFQSNLHEIMRSEYANRNETCDWFHEILDEMRRDRESQDKKWDKQTRLMWERWGEH